MLSLGLQRVGRGGGKTGSGVEEGEDRSLLASPPGKLELHRDGVIAS